MFLAIALAYARWAWKSLSTRSSGAGFHLRKAVDTASSTLPVVLLAYWGYIGITSTRW